LLCGGDIRQCIGRARSSGVRGACSRRSSLRRGRTRRYHESAGNRE
jgi:hypothetical protein